MVIVGFNIFVGLTNISYTAVNQTRLNLKRKMMLKKDRELRLYFNKKYPRHAQICILMAARKGITVEEEMKIKYKSRAEFSSKYLN